MASILKQDHTEASLSIVVLLIHCVVCLVASCLILFVRDARGEMVYGKAISKWVKQAQAAGRG
jgi:signal transduction histidine kinase